MEILILAVLFVVLFVLLLLIVFLLKGRTTDASARLDAALKDQFLNFQANIHRELDSTRTSVEGAKDVISSHAIQTIEQIRNISGTLQKLIQQQEEAQKLGASLKDLLQAPKLRGSYGEVVLEEMLERVLPRGVWSRQYSVDGLERVDCVIKFKDVVIPIDAKFPRDDYIRYLDAADPQDKAGCWKDFVRAVKTQIVSINKKYVKPEMGTSEFALMFIPSEGIYYETIAENNHLGDPSDLLAFAQEHHVFHVSPNTFYAFLQIVVLGLRNIEIIKSAKELQKGLASLERSFGLFYKKHEVIGRSLEKASEAYRVGDDHILRYKRRLDETLKLEGLEAGSEPPGLEEAAEFGGEKARIPSPEDSKV